MVRPGPSFSVQDVAFGWRDAFGDLGCTVADFNFDDRLDFYASVQIEKDGELKHAFSRTASMQVAAKGILAACYEFWPDVVVVVSGFFIPDEVLELIHARGHKIVFLFTESPYEDDDQLHRAQHGDIILLNDPTNLELFREQNKNTFYVPHAYDPARHHPGEPDPDMACDFAFVGTGFPSRREFFEKVDWSGLDVLLAGSWGQLPVGHPLREFVGHRLDWCCDNAEAAELYRSAKTSLNLYRREAGHGGNTPTGPATADGWAMGPREVELAACGTWFARDPRPESDELFPMLPTFSEPAEIRPLLDWALTHEDLREEAAAKANAAIADRTFEANARWLLTQLDK